MASIRKKAITALKIVISAALIYFIYTKIDLNQVFDVVKKTNLAYLMLALLLFVVSKIIAALRLNLYFHQMEVRLSQQSNLKLYLLGMFYNLFLPGGIGGDAYKGYLIKKKFGIASKKIVSILVLDRLSGLVLLFIYACALALFMHNELIEGFKKMFLLGIVVSSWAFWYLNKTSFGYVFPVFWRSVCYSGLVQLAQVACAWFIIKSLSVETDIVAYLFIFLISSIVSVLPITLGGIGSREVTFFYGATLLGLNESTSVGISMIFFFITALVSLSGMGYHLKKPELNIDTTKSWH